MAGSRSLTYEELKYICELYNFPKFEMRLFDNVDKEVLSMLCDSYSLSFCTLKEKIQFLKWLSSGKALSVNCIPFWNIAIYKFFILLGIPMNKKKYNPYFIDESNIEVFKKMVLSYDLIDEDNNKGQKFNTVSSISKNHEIFIKYFTKCIGLIHSQSNDNNGISSLILKLSHYLLECFYLSHGWPVDNPVKFVLNRHYYNDSNNISSVSNEAIVFRKITNYLKNKSSENLFDKDFIDFLPRFYCANKSLFYYVLKTLTNKNLIKDLPLVLKFIDDAICDDDGNFNAIILGNDFHCWYIIARFLRSLNYIDENINQISSQTRMNEDDVKSIKYILFKKAICLNNNDKIDDFFNNIINYFDDEIMNHADINKVPVSHNMRDINIIVNDELDNQNTANIKRKRESENEYDPNCDEINFEDNRAFKKPKQDPILIIDNVNLLFQSNAKLDHDNSNNQFTSLSKKT